MLRKPSRFGIVAALTLCASLAATSWGRANERATEFNIPPQSLDSALLIFAKQAGAQVSVATTTIAGMRTPGVVGKLTPSVALTQLLAETDLQFSTVGDRTYAVEQGQVVPNAGAQQPKAASQPTVPTTPSDAAAAVSESASEGAKKKNPRNDASGEPDAAELGDLVVTGSYIRGVTPDSSPLTIYDRENIERTGVGTVEQFLRKIPQNFASVDSDTFLSSQTTRNVSRGSAVNLRGLGAGSTLVLLNGNRMASAGGDGSFVDVSMIPLSAIERVEILNDGASAIYGADAVAGVVNFVLRRSFEGAESSVRYGDTSSGGAAEFGLSQMFGNSWDRGNAMIVYDYGEQDGLRSDQRDYIPPNPANGATQVLPQQRRHSVFLTGRQDLTTSTDIFADAYYSKRKFEQDDSVALGQVEHFEGETTQLGATLGAGVDFGDGWRATAVGNYGKEKEDRSRDLDGVNTPIPGTRSELMSLDLRADGPLFSAAGGRARASIGVGARREEFDDLATSGSAGQGLRRDVASLFAEVFIPFIGEGNTSGWAHRLELSLAARRDDYEDLGSSTDPKIGLLWAPVRGLALRGTYSNSFRVPPLAQLSNASREYFLFPFADPNAPDGVTNTLLLSAPGNPDLGPEEADSFTVGFDIRPPRVPGLSVSATYFKIDYSNRIAGPPIVGSPFDIYLQTATLAPFMDLSPDLPAIQEDIDRGALFTDILGIGFANSEAVFDFRVRNIAVTKTSGVEFAVEHEFDSTLGHLGVFLGGSYLFDLDFRPASTTSQAELVNKTFNPMDLRLRTGITWSRRSFSSAFTVNYSDEYENNLLSPPGRVDAWTTADWQLTFRTSEGDMSSFFDGLTLTLNVQNLTNEDPPAVSSNGALFYDFGYDVTNAEPRGRVISASITKQW